MEIIIKGLYDLTLVTVSTALVLAPRAIDAYLEWRGYKNAPEETEQRAEDMAPSGSMHLLFHTLTSRHYRYDGS